MFPRLLLVTSLLFSPLFSQSLGDDLTPPEISYTVQVLKDLKTLGVGIHINHAPRPHLRLSLPIWSPGAYFVMGYGNSVHDFSATDPTSGEPLEALRTDPQSWSIDTSQSSEVQVSYTVPAGGRFFFFRRRPASGNRPTTGFTIRGPSTFMYVVGEKARPVTVRYKLPQGWELANGLLTTQDPAVRAAKDYDTFIDAPTLVGHFKRFGFKLEGVSFSCVFFNNEQEYDFDMQGFTDICRRIAQTEGHIYGSFPYSRYVFLFTLPGGGGLEHLNSTSIGLNPGRMKKDVSAGASVTAHEFFHGWNVKRIRPIVLGPFDYRRENYTGNLYVSEGWTSYYGDLTLARSAIITQDAWLKLIEGIIKRELNKEDRKQHSVYWASRHVWHRGQNEPARVDYYGKGELLGLLIDLSIRQATKNRKSLDDVMRFFNRWFAERGVGFQENDVERACTAISNHDFREFFARHVFGTLDPPLKTILAYAGIQYEGQQEVQASLPSSLRRGRRGGAGLRVVGYRRFGQPSEGLRPGDLILAIDGMPGGKWRQNGRGHTVGQKVTVRFSRAGREQELAVSLVAKTRLAPHLSWTKDPTPLQKKIRQSLLGGN